MVFSLASPAFQRGQCIPERYSRDGGNVSPPLQWQDAPRNTRSFAVVVEDPDAPRGTFRHWGIYNVPPVRDVLDAAQPHVIAQAETVATFQS